MANALVHKTADGFPTPLGDLDSYVQAIHRVPMLSADRERELAVQLREYNDLDAARQLVLSHLRFVVHIARGYMGYGLPLGDLIQEGNIGMMKAVRRFDPSLNVRLVSFAVHWIRAEIHEYILRNWRIVKVATTKAQRKLFFNLRSSKKRLGWFTRQEVDTVAGELGVSPDTVMEMESRLSGQDVPFDVQPDEEDDEDRAYLAPSAYLQDLRQDPASSLEERDWETHNTDQLHRALGELDGRSRDILQRRWLAEPKATLQELADEYGISAERIRQLEKNAIKKLRGAMAPA